MHSSTCETIRAALEKLLLANGSVHFNSSVEVRAISDGGPPAYIIKTPQSCGPLLAEQLSGITGRILLSYEPSFVLFHDICCVCLRRQSVYEPGSLLRFAIRHPTCKLHQPWMESEATTAT